MTYWLIVVSKTAGGIVPALTKKFEGTRKQAEQATQDRAQELGESYLVVYETDKQARLYGSYRQFQGNDEETGK